MVMRYFFLAVVLCLVLACPCLAAPYKGFDPNANDVYSSPEVIAARQNARGATAAAQIVANQMQADVAAREKAHTQNVVLAGVTIIAVLVIVLFFVMMTRQSWPKSG